MKVIIAGTRNFKNINFVFDAIRESNFIPITEVVSGGCSGVDSIGEHYAMERGLLIKSFNADWNKHGKSAGPIRNRQMAEYADALIAVWDGKSKGTKNMIQEAFRNNLKIHVAYF